MWTTTPTKRRPIPSALSDPDRAEEILTELPDDLKEDIGAVLDAYGNLDHNTLLETVYENYPAYARKSRLRKGVSFKGRPHGRRAKNERA